MHPQPDRSGHRVIEGERVSRAVAAIARAGEIQARARQFAILADPPG